MKHKTFDGQKEMLKAKQKTNVRKKYCHQLSLTGKKYVLLFHTENYLLPNYF